ncbi:hypothetical protein PNIG_a0667 [Pseudoalteromonas nigrifaciens]|uniref:Uncharacterized protein n=1 Tax=Pseudoalteromonas nigrifaciens TaxID=28109 RepID=A0AAC9XWP9_9GAMM|nr:hypothetical protein PNIG_a0667 [Pseudoalteromonas nigrifaciens]
MQELFQAVYLLANLLSNIQVNSERKTAFIVKVKTTLTNNTTA